MPSPPVQAEIKMKKPSIERFLGSSHEQFMRAENSSTSKVPSMQGPKTDSEPPCGATSTDAASNYSTAGNPVTVPSESEKQQYKYPDTTTTTESLAVIKSVPMPRFPIRVFNGRPPPFSRELQRRKIRWRYDWFQNLEPHCIQDPDIHRIQETARLYVKSIAPKSEIISVSLLARGMFNQAYTITAENSATGSSQEFIFRVSLPIWPHYKVESDVATTEFVRHATSIPVPIIYAFDSNPNNNLGFEWMLMEKIQGTPLASVWDTMEFDTKQAAIRKLASWMAELSHIKFSKIGSIFMRYWQCQMEFYIGPAIHEKLFEGDRLLHKFDRGPFQSVQALYGSILDTAERSFSDLRSRGGHAQEVSVSKDSDVHEALTRPDEACDTDQCPPDSEDAILARADAEDLENEEANGFLKHRLSQLPQKLRRYRILLPKLCALLPASEPLTTILTHPDLLPPNIFVDNTGVPLALIDWEKAWLEPIGIIDVMPRFLDDDCESDALYAPPGTTVPSKDRSAHVYDYDSLARIRGRSEWNYEQVMGRIQRTRLRTVYQEEMKRLKSPVCKVFDRNPEGFEQELMRRVYCPESPGNTAPDYWAAKYLGESMPDDSDEEQE